MASPVSYLPVSSSVTLDFWVVLSHLKLHKWKLNEAPVAIRGFIRIEDGVAGEPRGPRLELRRESLADELAAEESAGEGHPGALLRSRVCESVCDTSVCEDVCVNGIAIIYNTAEAFKSVDRAAMLRNISEQRWSSWKAYRGTMGATPDIQFVFTAFLDLKSHSHAYWFAFPSMVVAEEDTAGESGTRVVRDIFLPAQTGVHPLLRADDATAETRMPQLTAAQMAAMYTALERTRCVSRGRCLQPHFVLEHLPDARVSVHAFDEFVASGREPSTQTTFAIIDGVSGIPATAPSHPIGWFARDFINRVGATFEVNSLWLACLRPSRRTLHAVHAAGRESDLLASTGLDTSILLQVQLTPLRQEAEALPRGFAAIGWEANRRGALGPKVANLKTALDPASIATASATLNLNLMRWRMLPELNLEKITATRCLVLGAGTLGCHLARDLLAWGFRHFTFVDNGRVSISNPLRQPLYTFADALAEDGAGALKAQAAAEALQRIHPHVHTAWHQLYIAMPGHPVHDAEAAKCREACEKLEALIAEHDVVWLLTDTRESRWLPTLLAAAHHKLAMTVALGFDSFLTMRHGVPNGEPGDDSRQHMLGCYFCNDVVAPADSTTNRTLDQQCTVTRPGVSPISTALAVEMLVALLHHPDGVHAAADGVAPLGSATASPLGLVPHQIRGFLTHLHTMLMHQPAFVHCTACSDVVVREYHARGFGMLLDAFNIPGYLEELTGLAALHASVGEETGDWIEDDFAMTADDSSGDSDASGAAKAGSE